jgi:hypothetical protein
VYYSSIEAAVSPLQKCTGPPLQCQCIAVYGLI